MSAGSTALPRLISVVEIIKREYLKALDDYPRSVTSTTGIRRGLHQYNWLKYVESPEANGHQPGEEMDELLRISESKQQYVPPRNYVVKLARFYALDTARDNCFQL